MDRTPLDLISRRMATARTRRSMFGLLAGGLAAATVGAADAAAGRGNRRKRGGSSRGNLVACPKSGDPNRCGPGCCPDGLVCCNALHGICVREGMHCAQ